jgi:hypothetical protein
VRNGTIDTTTNSVIGGQVCNGAFYQDSAAAAPWNGYYASAGTLGKWTGPTATTPCTSGSSSSSSSSGGSSGSGTTAALLNYINGLSGQPKYILTGQHADYWSGSQSAQYLDTVNPIPGMASGQQVAILGTSNFWCNSDGVTSSTGAWFVSATNNWIAQNGIVLDSQEACVPWSSGEAVTDIYTVGTTANKNWNSFLNAQIAMLKQLIGPVLWRPFIEVNGNHFGSQFTPAQFKLAWQYTVNYCKSQGLSNVLYVFSLNYYDPNNQASQWYPGNAYVDIVSLDS